MSNEVNVKFPSKMTVEAPGTDNMIRSLTEAFKGLSLMMQKGVTEVTDALQTLKQLPTLVRNLELSVGTHFSSLFVHSVEGQMVARKSTILSSESKEQACKRRIDDKGLRLKEDNSRVQERYQKLLAGVSEETAVRVKQLDSHALDLLAHTYPQQVQDAFSFESSPLVDFLVSQSDEAAETRTVALELAGAAARGAISEYLAKQAEFHAKFSDRCLHENFAPGEYEIAYSVVEVEDIVSGRIHRKIVFDFEHERVALPPETVAELKAAALKTEAVGGGPVAKDIRQALGSALGAQGGVDISRVAEVVNGSMWAKEKAA